MYIERSKYNDSVRVRIVVKVLVGNSWKKKLVKHIGTSNNEIDLEALLAIAKNELYDLKQGEQTALDLVMPTPKSTIETVGEYWQLADLVLGRLYDQLNINSDITFLRPMVIARLLYPSSKLQTAKFLTSKLDVNCSKFQLYRAMDNIAKLQKDITKDMRAFVTTNYPEHIGYVLYDVTTLYFETEIEDEDKYIDNESVIEGLRKKGYSKDHRGDLPQVVLGLAVNKLGKVVDQFLTT